MKEMNNTGFLVVLTGALACVSVGANASLSPNATLTFDSANSNFNLEGAGAPPTPISSFDGIILGTTQPASGSHTGAIDGTEHPSIDNPWVFFLNTGMSQTTSNVTITSDDGAGHVELNFSGWSVTWNGVPNIALGSGAFAGNPEGTAVMTCANTCENGDTYTLDYSATIPNDGTTNFGGVPYSLHLEGAIVLTGHLPTNAVLNFDSESSSFTLGDPSTATPTFIDSFDGIVLGTTQPASGSHTGPIDGSEKPSVDNAWEFAGNTGMSQTTGTPVTVINEDDPSHVTLDFAGWGVTWNGIANIPLPSGAMDPNLDGIAVMSCANACEEGDTYALDYTATVPADDPSGFGGAPYALHLEGTIGVSSGGGGGGGGGGGHHGGSGCTMSNNNSPSQAEWWLLAGFIGWLGWNQRKRKTH
jgi:hypothetical protein